MNYWIRADMKHGPPFYVPVEAGNVLQAHGQALKRLREEGVNTKDVTHLAWIMKPTKRPKGAKVLNG